jgi:hypothetical protein
LAELSIDDLWCLEELYEHLAWTAMSFDNQPRALGKVGEHAGKLWDKGFNGPLSRIINELEHRKPTVRSDIEHRAAVLIKWAAEGGDFTRVIALGAEALQALDDLEQQRAAA